MTELKYPQLNDQQAKLSSLKKIQKQQLQSEIPQKSILSEDFTFNAKTMNLYFSQKLARKQHITKVNAVPNKLLTQQFEVVLINKTSEDKKFELSTRISTSYDPEKCQELILNNLDFKKRSYSYNKSCIQRQKSINFASNINRQIFQGAFYQQFNQMYKNLGEVMDIDSYYLRSFKKQRQEVKDQIIFNRMNQVVNLMVRNMPKVQKSINNYSQQYEKSCPSQIKTFHMESKILKPEPIKQLKSLSLQKSYRERLNFPQKLKSEQGINNHDKQIQKLFKSSKANRLKQRNKSFQQIQQRFLRKSSQQKVEVQAKFPTVYSPQLFSLRQDMETQNGIAIHQKFQNFTTNMNKLQNKGLIRYKLLNKNRTNNVVESDNFVSQKSKQFASDVFQTKKLSDFEVTNIRKLLRIREKDKMTARKSPLISGVKQNKQDIEHLMAQVHAMDLQRSKQLCPYQKTNKFQVFLSTLNDKGTKNGFTLRGKSSKFNHQKDIEFSFSSRKKQSDYLPKLI